MDSPKSIFGSEESVIKIGKRSLECYLLPGFRPMLERRSFQKVLGYDGRSNRWLYDFLIHLSRNTPISIDLMDEIQANRFFSVANPNGDISLKVAINPILALRVCKIISKANQDGLLYLSELKYAKAADTILEQLPEDKIERIISFVSGFDRFKMNFRELLMRTIDPKDEDKSFRWILSLPDSFLEAVFEFYSITWEEAAENSLEIAQFLTKFIFERLDSELLKVLQTEKSKMSYAKTFATETYQQHTALSEYVQGLMALMRLSNRHLALLSPLMDKAYPTQRIIALQTKKIPTAAPSESFQNALQKGYLLRKK